MLKNNHTEPGIETGLLSIFRLTVGLRFLILVLSSSEALFKPYHETGYSFMALSLFEILFLFTLLRSKKIPELLGKAYLPLCLAINVLVPVGEAYLMSMAPEHSLFENVSSLLLIIWLPPLLMTAWQYTFRAVFLFCLGTVLLQTWLWFSIGNQDPYSLLSVVGMRTLLFALTGYLIVQLMNIQRQQRRELITTYQQLAEHAATVEQLAISRERNRVSRELHDTLAHTLSGLAVHLDSFTLRWPQMPPDAIKCMDQSLETVRSGLDETRRALQNLRSAPLEDLGLCLALRSYASSLSGRIQFDLSLDVPDNIDSIPVEVEHTFYRVAREALENTIRHADAKHATLQLILNNRMLSLEITDDGKGFDIDDKDGEKHFGLRGIRERAEMINAQIKINSRIGQGTSILLSWSLLP